MSHRTNIASIAEVYRKHNFTLEKLFSEGTKVKFVQFRHSIKGYLFMLYINSKYDMSLTDKYNHINTPIIYDKDISAEDTNYEMSFGTELDEKYGSLCLDTSTLELNFTRFMSSVKFHKNVGLFIMTEFTINHITSDNLRKYKPASSNNRNIVIIPVISIEEIVNWTNRTELMLENMVPNLFMKLGEINRRHSTTVLSLREALNDFEKVKAKYDLKIIALQNDHKKYTNQLNDTTSKIQRLEREYQINTSEVAQQQNTEHLLETLHTNKRKLFIKISDLNEQIGTYYIFMDEIVSKSHKCMEQLAKLIENMSNHIS